MVTYLENHLHTYYANFWPGIYIFYIFVSVAYHFYEIVYYVSNKKWVLVL